MDLKRGWIRDSSYGSEDCHMGKPICFGSAYLHGRLPNEGFKSSCQTRDGKLKSTLPTGPLRIFDFVVSKDLDRIIAITNVVGGQTHGNLRPTASRLPVAGAIPGRIGSVLNENSSVPNYSIGKMERDIVIYDLANGNVIA